MKRFYVDTCIWLNLFKKEGDASKGFPYWKIAEDFIEKVIFSEECEIIYSNIILKEIYFDLGDERLFNERLSFIRKEKKFKFVLVAQEDRQLARKFESESGYCISFYDCINIAICLRLGFILVTRDKALIDFARKYIEVEKPENLPV